MLDRLRIAIAARMSESRYQHTLSVERECALLAARYLTGQEKALRAAALLHDLTKALPTEKQLLLAKQGNIVLPKDAECFPAILHSYTAEAVIREQFPEFATEEILNAIKKHTVGHRDMSVFDKILFLADYIEPTRAHESCKALRRDFLSALAASRSENEALLALDRAVFSALSATVSYLKSANLPILPEAYEVYKAFSDRLSG